MADSTKNIIVLGGSYAGISASHYLLKHTIPKLHTPSSYRLILISASSQILCRPACPRALISDDMFDQSKLFVDIPTVFAQYPADSFRFIQGTATELDHVGQKISFATKDNKTESLDFHALVIATGASTSSPLLGLNKDEVFLKESWAEFRKALPGAKSIIIAGGGPAGIEIAGELGEYLNGCAGWFAGKLENPNVAITVVTAGPKILPLLRDSIGKKAEIMLGKIGVTVVKNMRVESVEPIGAGMENVGSQAKVKLADGTVLEADLYIPATGITPNTGFISKDILTADGRVETNTSTLRVDKSGKFIYAVGDVASTTRPAVHLILNAIPVLCTNIGRDLMPNFDGEVSHGEDRIYKDDITETQLVPIGKSKGVGAAMGYQIPSWMVWLIKGRDYWLWTTGNLWNGKQWAKES